MTKTALSILVAAQRASGHAPFGIFTDLDGTLIAAGQEQTTDEIAVVAASHNWPLIAMTGRDSARVLAEIDRRELPEFAAIITAVGTEVWLRKNGEYRPDGEYRDQLTHIYDRPAVLASAQAIVRKTPAALRLQFQDKSEPFKVSLTFAAKSDPDITAVLTLFVEAFPEHKIIISEDVYHAGIYNLDVLPAGKADAVRHIMKTYGIAEGVVAGDSENDLDALAIAELTAIWVEDHSGPATLLHRLQQLAARTTD